MGREHIYFQNSEGSISGHICLLTIDATFKHNDKKINMYFHNYLGPSFYIVENGEEYDIYPGEEKEYESLWKQFYLWWRAKGRNIYKD